MTLTIGLTKPVGQSVYFSEEALASLWEGHREVVQENSDLRQLYVGFAFQTAGAIEHAQHGFARRLGVLERCVTRVFETLPPDREAIPARVETIDATINIQSFIMNAFGCCENLAWIWVYERNIQQPNGERLPIRMVGLGPAHKLVRRSLSVTFRAHLESERMHAWFLHLKQWRDALAHRIPLYIPPFVVPAEQVEKYNALGAAANRALFMEMDVDKHRRLDEEKMLLVKFRPTMMHSFIEEANPVLFHAQLLADFNTVSDLGRRLLSDLGGE